MEMKNIFTDHPRSIGVTYFEHMKFAALYSAKMFLGGIACLIHAIFPFVFQKTGSNFLLKIMHEYISHLSQPDQRITALSEEIKKKLQTIEG
jgi:hypothetical protein